MERLYADGISVQWVMDHTESVSVVSGQLSVAHSTKRLDGPMCDNPLRTTDY